jgi:hypothetical protein
VLRAQLAPTSAPFTAGLWAPLSRVFLAESTPCRLHEKWAATCQGSGGRASTATVKMVVSWALRHHRLQALVVTAGRAADQGHAAAMLPHLRGGALVIRDRGYLSLEALCQVATKQAGGSGV